MRVFLKTYGCRANQYDSEQIATLVRSSGGELVEDAAEADYAIFNSCAVTAEAEADLRHGVRNAARTNPRLRSVVTGCVAGRVLQHSSDLESVRSLPLVGGVVAPGELSAVADALGLRRSAGAPLATRQSGARALLRIQDGCDEHCTFCVTTLARGDARSRSIEALVAEAEVLAEHHPEIVLTGTHIGSYGVDIGSSLSTLVRTLIDRVPKVRFRLSSLEATEVDEQLADILRSGSDRLAPYLHAPLQSGSDRLLKRMGRHWYTSAMYRKRMEGIVRDRPVFGLGADIITGFPGETAEDHQLTMCLVKELPFTTLHVFPYSPRPGTAALRLDDRTNSSIARERARELRAIGAEKSDAYARTRAEYPADVVVISEHRGITEDFVTVALASPAVRGRRFRAALVWRDGVLNAGTLGG